jgi:hypothetical protein
MDNLSLTFTTLVQICFFNNGLGIDGVLVFRHMIPHINFLVPHLFGILFVSDPLNLQHWPAFVNFKKIIIVCQRVFVHGA